MSEAELPQSSQTPAAAAAGGDLRQHQLNNRTRNSPTSQIDSVVVPSILPIIPAGSTVVGNSSSPSALLMNNNSFAIVFNKKMEAALTSSEESVQIAIQASQTSSNFNQNSNESSSTTTLRDEQRRFQTSIRSKFRRNSDNNSVSSTNSNECSNGDDHIVHQGSPTISEARAGESAFEPIKTTEHAEFENSLESPKTINIQSSTVNVKHAPHRQSPLLQDFSRSSPVASDKDEPLSAFRSIEKPPAELRNTPPSGEYENEKSFIDADTVTTPTAKTDVITEEGSLADLKMEVAATDVEVVDDEVGELNSSPRLTVKSGSGAKGSVPRRASLPAHLTFRYNAATESVKAKEAPDTYSLASNGLDSNDEGSHLAVKGGGRLKTDSVDSCDSSNLSICDRSIDLTNGELSKSVGSEKRLNVSGNDKKRKSSYWYNVLSPTYKSKCEDFKKISKDIPNEERLVVDYSCALQKDILVHGRLYITQNWLCFYANIFRWETVITIRLKDITSMTKEKTARVIPNAIQICKNNNEKLFFTSFGARDKTYLMLFRVWQNALLEQPMSPSELWQWVHYSYGEELGLTSSDDDYIPPSSEDKISDNQVSPGTDSSLDQFQNEENDSFVDGKDNDSMVPSGVEELHDGESCDVDAGPTKINDNNQKKSVDKNMNSAPPDADIPTDVSDNTDCSEGEVTCAGHDHLHLTMIDEIFHINVDTMFNNLFTDSAFFREFYDIRKIFDLILNPWQDETDANGDRNREITYTVTLNASFGPKVATTTEKQLYYSHSKPGVIYVIDCETINGRIPYGDSFGILNRYCITRVNTLKCRLKVTSEIVYKKSVWGMVKGIIDKNCTIGLNEHFQMLAEKLRDESDKAAILAGQQTVKKKVRRKRRGQSITDNQVTSRATPDVNTIVGPPTAMKGAIVREEWVVRLNAETLVRILGICLLVLILFNGLLYYKLWTLESQSARFHRPAEYHYRFDDLGKYPKNKEEWLALLKTQQYLHDNELERWKGILGSSITLIEQMKTTLVELQKSIDRSHGEHSSNTATSGGATNS
ncbi:protein Aster-B-like isoform X2 [Tubulanus polymorphus]|uniref:protein Aster-B-like isoform X2 n=1 Tax=Tubulanus polymorphus TaxID=672921 RepID=UPI003DA4FABE